MNNNEQIIAKDLFTREVEVTAVSNRRDCYKEEKCDVTLLPYRSKISGSQHSFLTETAIFIVERWENASATVLFLSAILRRKVTHVNFVVFYATFAGPRSVEIQKFCCHSNVT